ncbi:hypothetical protein DESC_810081 [Desulfosarcina cetonica]|nr:hypothetical protein DESC_810081 [Desulfosarcina cetonica]
MMQERNLKECADMLRGIAYLFCEKVATAPDPPKNSEANGWGIMIHDIADRIEDIGGEKR